MIMVICDGPFSQLYHKKIRNIVCQQDRLHDISYRIEKK